MELLVLLAIISLHTTFTRAADDYTMCACRAPVAVPSGVLTLPAGCERTCRVNVVGVFGVYLNFRDVSTATLHITVDDTTTELKVRNRTLTVPVLKKNDTDFITISLPDSFQFRELQIYEMTRPGFVLQTFSGIVLEVRQRFPLDSAALALLIACCGGVSLALFLLLLPVCLCHAMKPPARSRAGSRRRDDRLVLSASGDSFAYPPEPANYFGRDVSHVSRAPPPYTYAQQVPLLASAPPLHSCA